MRFQQSNSVFGGQVEQPQITSPASSSAKPNTNLQTPINNALEKYISDPLSKAIDPFVSAISRGTDNILGVGQQKSSSPISLQVSKAINSQASKSKTSKTAGSIETEEIEIEFEDDDDQTSQPVKTYTAPQPIQTSKTVSTQQPAQKQQPFDPWAGLNQLFDDLSGNKKK